MLIFIYATGAISKIEAQLKNKNKTKKMAGAGPVSEKLPSIVVPQLLSEGGRFLKWDEVNIFILRCFPLLKLFLNKTFAALFIFL